MLIYAMLINAMLIKHDHYYSAPGRLAPAMHADQLV